jgi:hypothetical protein
MKNTWRFPGDFLEIDFLGSQTGGEGETESPYGRQNVLP